MHVVLMRFWIRAAANCVLGDHSVVFAGGVFEHNKNPAAMEITRGLRERWTSPVHADGSLGVSACRRQRPAQAHDGHFRCHQCRVLLDRGGRCINRPFPFRSRVERVTGGVRWPFCLFLSTQRPEDSNLDDSGVAQCLQLQVSRNQLGGRHVLE